MAPRAAKAKAKKIPIKKKELLIEAIEKEGDVDSIQDLSREDFTGGYDTDVSDYIMPDPRLRPSEEEGEDAVLLAQSWKSTDKSTWFFNESATKTIEWYQSVLGKTLWLPTRLQRLFLFKEEDLNFMMHTRKMRDLNTKLEKQVARETFGITRKCITAFFRRSVHRMRLLYSSTL